MYYFNVSIYTMIIYIVACICSVILCYKITRMKLSHVTKALQQLPVYLIRVFIGLVYPNIFRIFHAVILIVLINYLIEGLKYLFGWSFLFHQFTLPTITLGFILAFVFLKKIFFLVVVLAQKDKYLKNTQRMRKNQEITKSKFHLDLLYSFSSSVVYKFRK